LSERAAYGSGRVITDDVVRAGIVHDNTPEKVDRLLEGLAGEKCRTGRGVVSGW
jgi:selenocysteine lyase/cysteine desulfurase